MTFLLKSKIICIKGTDTRLLYIQKEMRTNYNTILEKIHELIQHGKYTEIHVLIDSLLPEDIAFLLNHIQKEQRVLIFKSIEEHTNLSKIIREIDKLALSELIEFLSDSSLEKALPSLDSSEIAHVVDSLPQVLKERVWAALGKTHQIEAQAKLQYPEDSAGRIMSTAFFLAKPEDTVLDTFLQLKESSENQETSYNYIYIADSNNYVLGVVSLHDLIRQPNHAIMKDIMRTEVIHTNVNTDREQVAYLVERYNLTALPIVNDSLQIVGIVPVDDVIDILRSEATEDIMKLAGTSNEDISLRSPFHSFFLRIPWLVVSFCGGLLTIQSNLFFSSHIPVEMFAFVTIIIGMGGNIASQSSVIVIRGIATGKFLISQLSKLLLREACTAVLIGSFFGTILGIFTHFNLTHIAQAGVAVGLAMLCSTVLAAIVGSLMPILFYKIHVDPAIATGPFVSTTIDNIGLITYFSITLLFLHSSLLI